eukprot:m51a1_g5874 hypothetical protein (1549) ;mRNA; f:460507-484051
MAMEVEASTALEGQLRRGGGQLSAEAVRASGQWAALLRGLPSAGAGALAELLLDLRCCPSPSAPPPLRLTVVELCQWPSSAEVRVSSGQRTAALSVDDLKAALREPLVAALFEALLPTAVPALIEGLVYVDPPPRQQQRQDEEEGSPCNSGDSSTGDNTDEETPPSGPVDVPATADLPAAPNSSRGTGTGDSNHSTRTNADSLSHDCGDGGDDDHDHDHDHDDGDDSYGDDESSSSSDSSDEEMGVSNNTSRPLADKYVSTERVIFGSLLSFLSSVYGHGRIVSLALPPVQARLRSADWRVLESALKAVSTLMTNEDTAVLEPHMSELMGIAVNSMRHTDPLVRVAACRVACNSKNYGLFACLTTVVNKLGSVVEPYAEAIASNCLRLALTPAKYKYARVTKEPLCLLAAVIRAFPGAVVPLLDGFPLVRLLVDDLESYPDDGKTQLIMALARHALKFVEPLLPRLMEVLLAVPNEYERLEAVGHIALVWGEPFRAFVPRVLEFLLGAFNTKGTYTEYVVDPAAVSLGHVCRAACDTVAPLLDNAGLTLWCESLCLRRHNLSAMAMEVEASTALEGQLRRGGGQLSAEAVRASGQWAALLRGLPSAGAGALAELLLDLRCCPSPSAPSPLRLTAAELRTCWPPRTEVRLISGQRTAALSDDDLQTALREPLVAALFEALLPTVVSALIEGLVYVDPPPRKRQEEEEGIRSSGDRSMSDNTDEEQPHSAVAVSATASTSTNADSLSHDSDHVDDDDDDDDHDVNEDDDSDDGYDDESSGSSNDSSDEEVGVSNNTSRPLADKYVSTERVIFGSLLSFLSSVYGHGCIVSLALPLVQARLRSADWRVLESALEAVSTLMTNEDTAVLEPHMSELMGIAVNSMHHADPLLMHDPVSDVRKTACIIAGNLVLGAKDYAGLTSLHELVVKHEALGLASFEDDLEYQRRLLEAISKHATACANAPVHAADAVARRLVPMLVARLDGISTIVATGIAAKNYNLFVCLTTVVNILGSVVEPYAEAIASNCLRLALTPAKYKYARVTKEPLYGKTQLIMALVRYALRFVEPLLPRLMEILLAVPNDHERLEAVGHTALVWGEPFRAFVPRVLEFLLGAFSTKGTYTEYVVDPAAVSLGRVCLAACDSVFPLLDNAGLTLWCESLGQRTAALSDDDLQTALGEPLVAALFEALLPTVVPALIEGLVYADPPPKQRQQRKHRQEEEMEEVEEVEEEEEEEKEEDEEDEEKEEDDEDEEKEEEEEDEEECSTSNTAEHSDSDMHDDGDDDNSSGDESSGSSSASDSSDEEMFTVTSLVEHYDGKELVACGSLLSCLSSVYGHGRVVSLALPPVQARLRSADWRVLESALCALSMLMSEDKAAVLDPHMHELMALTMNAMRHAEPKVRVAACFVVFHCSLWEAPETPSAPVRTTGDLLEPVLTAVLELMHDPVSDHEVLGLSSYLDDIQFQVTLLEAIMNHVTVATADCIARQLAPALATRLEAISRLRTSVAAAKSEDLFKCLISVVDKLGAVIEPCAEAIASNCLRLALTPVRTHSHHI